MHMIFTEGDKSQLFFEREIERRLRGFSQNNRLTVDIVPGADHTFMPIRWQRTLGDLMTRRLLEHRVKLSGPAADCQSSYRDGHQSGRYIAHRVDDLTGV